ncbi:MAG: sporulation initiation factor Spo0A C-terminal domain-containing protein [Lactobacillus sp.]|nr:sporulation initiation factor Spo0A C-terminal domain-containing protein [Lactobacillus sp.]
MKNKAINALIEMGMPANIKGFRYIAEAMALFEEDEIWMMKTCMLYYKLSAMYNTTPGAVERAIRHAFSILVTRRELKTVEKYLSLQDTTNGNLLNAFFLRLSQEG